MTNNFEDYQPTKVRVQVVKKVLFGDQSGDLKGHHTKTITLAIEGIYELGIIHLGKGRSLHIIHLSQLDGPKLGKYLSRLDGITHPSSKFSNSKYDWCHNSRCRPSFTSLNNGRKIGQITINPNQETGWHYGYRLINKDNGLAFAYIYGSTPLPGYIQLIDFLKRSILHIGPFFVRNPLLTRVDKFTPQIKTNKEQRDAKLQFLSITTYGRDIAVDTTEIHKRKTAAPPSRIRIRD